MVDVRGDVLGPPHGTTPAAVKANKKKSSFKSNENIHRKRRWVIQRSFANDWMGGCANCSTWTRQCFFVEEFANCDPRREFDYPLFIAKDFNQ